jgi:iron(III) transport system permease protein
MPFIGKITLDTLSQLTFQNYRDTLEPRMIRATINTLVLACSGGLVITLLTTLTAYVSYRTRIKGRKIAEAISFFPVAYPSIFIGVALIWIFSYARFGIYGTLWMLLIAVTIRYMPVGMRILSPAVTQVHAELEEASKVCGARGWQTFFRIFTPLLKSTLLYTWLYVAILSIKQFSLIVLLYTTRSEVLSVLVWEHLESGMLAHAATTSTITILIVGVLFVVARKISGVGESTTE